MSNSKKKNTRNALVAMSFLAPNILGVMIFTVFPVVFSIVLAFTNWDLELHNIYKDNSIEFNGFSNFVRLFTESDFLKFLGNTLFLMMGIPFGVGGALFAAILLSKDTRGGGGKVYAYMIATTVLIVSVAILCATGMGATGMVLLIGGAACCILIMGMAGGLTVYRTLFYTPHFTAGVATFLLWKKLYAPNGPINSGLQPILDSVANVVNATSGAVSVMTWVGLTLIVLVYFWATGKLRGLWNDGELGNRAAILPLIFLTLPLFICFNW